MEHATIYDTGDPFAATVRRWAWLTDDDHRRSVDDARDRAAGQREALTRLAHLLAAKQLPTPYVSTAYAEDADWVARWSVDDVEKARIVRRAIGTPYGAVWQKKTDGGHLSVELTGQRLQLVVQVTEQTCEKVDTGETQTVERYVDACPVCEADLVDLDDDRQACSDETCPYEMRRPVRVKKALVEPVVEWDCPDLNGDDEVTA